MLNCRLFLIIFCFLEDCSLSQNDWTLKEQSMCYTEKRRMRTQGPSPNLESISMQMLQLDSEEANHCTAMEGIVGFRCCNTHQLRSGFLL